MAFSRYARDRVNIDGKGMNTSSAIRALREAVSLGRVSINKTFTTTQSDRLDSLAGALYGDGRYWWVLAAGSNIGWGLQVPPGTIINVLNLREVERVVG